MNGATHKGYSNLHTSLYSSFLYRSVRRIYARERAMRELQDQSVCEGEKKLDYLLGGQKVDSNFNGNVDLYLMQPSW